MFDAHVFDALNQHDLDYGKKTDRSEKPITHHKRTFELVQETVYEKKKNTKKTEDTELRSHALY